MLVGARSPPPPHRAGQGGSMVQVCHSTTVPAWHPAHNLRDPVRGSGCATWWICTWRGQGRTLTPCPQAQRHAPDSDCHRPFSTGPGPPRWPSLRTPPAACNADPPASAIVDHPLVAGTGAEATPTADGGAAAFWWEFRQALLSRLGWSATVSEPMVSLAHRPGPPNRPGGPGQ